MNTWEKIILFVFLMGIGEVVEKYNLGLWTLLIVWATFFGCSLFVDYCVRRSK